MLRCSVIPAAALLLWQGAAQAIPAFPGAEGFGADNPGGRGGDVYHVTNLNDGGVGSLRHGIENAPGGGRTIVFDVGGWIDLNSKLGVTRDNITIAGQTAPGGVGVRGNQFSVGADDIVVRHMRFRPGKSAGRVDAVNVNNNSDRVIFDHVSAQFAFDENFSVQGRDITLQYSSVAYGMVDHSAGSLIEGAGKLSFHHNLYAHNETRNPKARAELIDWRDNVVYNYHNGFIAGDSETDVNPNWRANFDGNTYISNVGGSGRPMMTGGRTQNYDLYYGLNALDRDGDHDHEPIVYTRDQARSSQSIISSAYNWFAAPFPAPDVWQAGGPAAAYDRVLEQFGATPWDRDEVDQLLHNQVATHTGSRISRESQLPGITNGGFATLGGLPAPIDTDRDGMPDAWEVAHGLDPNSADHNGDFDNDGYTNLEDYLHDLAAFAAPGPIEFGGINNRYALSQNWTHGWQPSRHDTVHVRDGAAVVDAVGQHGGVVVVAPDDGDSAVLSVTSGWLIVHDELIVGGTDTAQGVLVLHGGALTTPLLRIGDNSVFSFTGGSLHADIVVGDLTNDGGTLAPGNSTGATHVQGRLTLQSGTLQIEAASAADFDTLEVDGVATLGGTLALDLINGFTPKHGDTFTFLTAGSIVGRFDHLLLPDLTEDDLALSLNITDTRAELRVIDLLPGDANHDGRVDAFDLGLWQTQFGMTGQGLSADFDGDHDVDTFDLGLWQLNFGTGLSAAVPEPTGAMATTLLAPLLLRRRAAPTATTG